MTISYNVSRYPFTMGTSRDSETGWLPITYDTAQTKEMVIRPRGTREFFVPAGYYGALDAVGKAVDVFTDYDHVLTGDGRRYVIPYIHEDWDGDNFLERHCALQQITALWEEQPGATTWSLTRPRDPRYRTKYWLDTYITDSQITKDDDSTQATYAVIFADPPYSIEVEFRADTSPVQGLFCVGFPVETGLVSAHTQAAYGYSADVPVTVVTVDSTDCSGTSLWWKMIAELKSVNENQAYLSGSLRTPLPLRPESVQLGGVKVYMGTYHLQYQRSAAT